MSTIYRNAENYVLSTYHSAGLAVICFGLYSGSITTSLGHSDLLLW